MNAKTVYIVHSPSYNDTTVIYGVFDLKERLDNFLDRFKDRIDDVEIKEMPLNPTFPGDKTRNPYCATLFRDGTAMLHIISNPADAYKAIKDEYEIVELDGELSRVFYYLMAETREAAWTEAIVRFEKLVELDEFCLDGEIRMEE